MTVNMLIQIDKLVQLLESPVFTCMLFLTGKPSDANGAQISGSNCLNLSDTHNYINVSTVF